MSLYGLDSVGQKIKASHGARATCSGCGSSLIAKCGTINAWHWAHLQKECDPWHEPEGAWHLGWKSLAPKEWTEVSMGPHRADIRRDDGLVIELQASSISAPEVWAREDFYGEMVWLLDGRNFDIHLRGWDNEKIQRCCSAKYVVWHQYSDYSGEWLGAEAYACKKGRHIHEKGQFVAWEREKERGVYDYMQHRVGTELSFYWRRRKKSFDRSRVPIYIDLGPQQGVLEVRERFLDEVRGFLHSRQEFAEAAGLTWRDDAVVD